MMPGHFWQGLLPYNISDDPGVSYILIKLTLPAYFVDHGDTWAEILALTGRFGTMIIGAIEQLGRRPA